MIIMLCGVEYNSRFVFKYGCHQV